MSIFDDASWLREVTDIQDHRRKVEAAEHAARVARHPSSQPARPRFEVIDGGGEG